MLTETLPLVFSGCWKRGEHREGGSIHSGSPEVKRLYLDKVKAALGVEKWGGQAQNRQS